MRYFFSSYKGETNFKISVEKGVFGLKEGYLGSVLTKFMKLKKNDIVIIRNSNLKKLSFLGYCIVVGKPMIQSPSSPNPWPNYLWSDEISGQEIIYPCRVAVNFDPYFRFENLYHLSWDDFLNLEIKNKKGVSMEKDGLAKFMTGNFFDDPYILPKLLNILGYKEK